MDLTDGQPWYLQNYQERFSAKKERRVLSRIETVLEHQLEEKNAQRDTVHCHPSDLSKNDWCPRATYYKITGEVETDQSSSSLRRMNVFAEGHAIHDKWQKWMWQTGCLIGDWQCTRCSHRWTGKSPTACPDCGSAQKYIVYREVPIYDPEHMIIGHADGEWEDSNGLALIEIKSVGLGTIRWDAPDLYAGYESGELTLDDLWKRIKRPLLPHRRQINLYMYCRDLDKAIVIYEWKPTQEVKEFHLSYDKALVQPMLDGALLVKQAVSDQIPPPKPEAARKGGMCKFCPFKSKCWED